MNVTNHSLLETDGASAGPTFHRAPSMPAIAPTAASTLRADTAKKTRRCSRVVASALRHAGTSPGAEEASAVEPLLNFAAAARVLGISLRQFRRLVDGGRIAFVKVSERTPRVRPSELQRFLDASAVKYSEVQS
jgi:excisionase family DNA binding protein